MSGVEIEQGVGESVDKREQAPEPEAPVKRPEEPRQMPTRVTGTVRGSVGKRAIGADEVDAIADGSVAERPHDLTRVRREQAPPSIFGDQ